MPPESSSIDQFAVARLVAECRDRLFDLGKAHPVGVAQDRHDEPLLDADRDPDVVMVLVDDVVAVDLGVDPGNLLQCDDRRLDEDRHEAKANAVFFLKGLAPALAQRDRLAHVDFIEGGQHCRGVLRRLKALGDPPSQARHPHPNLALRRGSGGEGRAGVGGDASGRASASITSALVIRPPGPVGAIVAASSPPSAISFRTAGPERSSARCPSPSCCAGPTSGRRLAAPSIADLRVPLSPRERGGGWGGELLPPPHPR